jgi:dolichol-phosphate mannosyltransferase
VSDSDAPFISVVVPVYREAENIQPFLSRMVPVLERLGTYEIVFALDPSPDQTEAAILAAIQKNPNVRLVVFSRRFGQPAATLGGLAIATGRRSVVIDVDLQDPPELVETMSARMDEGFDVVYATRRSRKGETLTKRVVAYLGYIVIARLAEVPIPRDTGDFRVMSRRVVDQLLGLHEEHGFLRGLVAYVGFPQTFVEYDRDERAGGVGKYNRFLGSLRIGLNGIVSFGSWPLHLLSLFGFVLSGFSFLLGGWYVLQRLLGFDLMPGLPTTVLTVSFFAGIQLLSLGVIGEYVGRIYSEVKRRPRFIVDKKINCR